MTQLLLICTLLLGSMFTVLGQNHQLKGTVEDATSGDPLPRVAIVMKGTPTGTQTDGNGRFTLASPCNKTVNLELSLIGYKSQTVAVKSR